MSSLISFLIFDKNESNQTLISKIISENFQNNQIYYSDNNEDAFALIEKKHPSICICHDEINSLDAMELCEKIKSNPELKGTYFLTLTDNFTPLHIKHLMSKGCDDYIRIPINPEILEIRLHFAVKILKMQIAMHEENSLLHKLTQELDDQFFNLIKLSLKFLEKRIPSSYELLNKVAISSQWILSQFPDSNESRIREIKIASYFAQAGRISLPDNLLNEPVMIDGKPFHNLMYQVPLQAKEIVAEIKGLENVGDILSHIYENMDGSGMPDRISNWQIPLESRIIRVCLDYEELLDSTQMDSQQVLDYLNERVSRVYDKRAVYLLGQFLSTENQPHFKTTEKAVNIYELAPGMVTTRDLITTSGIKMMSAGTTLTNHSIEIINSHLANDPILGFVFVKK